MHYRAGKRSGLRLVHSCPPRRREQPWHQSHPRDSRPKNGTYLDPVAAAPSQRVDRVRFGRWVDRVVDRARQRGMTDDDIAAATGVSASTFHRWRRRDFNRAPELSRVRAFCAGLGEDPAEAVAALGLADARDNPEPEPPLPPEVKVILRALADPNVPDRDKMVIREMLLMLANQARAKRPRSREEGAA
jgi:hypothetical protein